MKQHIELSNIKFAIVTYYEKALSENGKLKYVDSDENLVEQERIIEDIELYEVNESGTEARIFSLKNHQFLSVFESVRQLMTKKVNPIAVEDIDY